MYTVIVGDLHIGKQWSGKDRSEDIFEILSYVLEDVNTEVSIRNEQVGLLFLGDIFDSPNVSHHYVARFINLLGTLKNLVCTSILVGNHDGNCQTSRGSPLQTIEEAFPSIGVIWEPRYEDGILYLPYTTQDVINKYLDSLGDTKFNYCFTHLDIAGLTPGTEKDNSKGLPCMMPDRVKEICNKIFAGHIHTPQTLDNITVVGSIIQTDISEVGQQKYYVKLYDSSKAVTGIEYTPINSREIKSYNIKYPDDKNLYDELLSSKGINKTDIVSIKLICPHNLAHEVDQFKFQDEVRKACWHLRFDFIVLKEKQFRMKDLDNTLSDIEILTKYLDSQNITDKVDILNYAQKVMED